MVTFSHVTHEAFVAGVAALAEALAADTQWTPTFLIGIGRGGLVPAVYLSHATGLPMLSVDHSSQVPDFSDAPLVRLATRTRSGAKLLFVDDINDTGRTIARMRAALLEAGAATDGVRFATLIDNVASIERVEYRARTIDRHVTKDWFIFPWEAVAPMHAIAADAAEVPERTA